jgi:hypothetical protein
MSSAASGRLGQFIAMLSYQLGNAKSLCEICGGGFLHLLVDHDGYLLSCGHHRGKKHQVHVARQMRFAPGTILFDRSYTDHEWFANFDPSGSLFCDTAEGKADYAA